MTDNRVFKSQAIGSYVVALALIFIMACGTTAPDTPVPATEPTPLAGETPQPTSTSPPGAEPTPTDAPLAEATTSGTLNIGLSELGTFAGHPQVSTNPEMFVFSTAIGEGLVSINQDLQAVPMLAESWTISPDFTTWTFQLQQGVQFHKGYGEMTSEDVVWSHQQWGLNAPHSRNANINAVWNRPTGYIRTPDPYTVEVNTGEPIADVIIYQFLASASGTPTWTVSKKQTEELGVEEANLQIAATGPWEIVDHRTGEFWRMKAVENHWRKTPHFAEMVFHEIPEESARLAGFQTGNLDTMTMTFDSIPLVESVPGAKLMQVPGAANMGLRIHGQYYLGLGTPEQQPGYNADLPWVSSNPNPASEEWDRARKVRLALVTAIDVESIIETLLRGFARPGVLTSWDGHEHLLDPDMKWEYDPDRARELLAEAGYPEGGFTIELSPAIRNAPSEVEVCEAVATMWGDIGIDVKLERIPFGTLRPRIINRNLTGATCHATSLTLAPATGVANLTSAVGANSGVEHPWLEDMAARATGAVDPEERAQLEREIARFVYDNVLTNISLYVFDGVWPVGPRIEEWNEGVQYRDLRAMNGFEYIRHRE